MFSNTAPTQDLIIAGQHSGKPVKITPAAKPVYDNLVKLARDETNYWAQITVKAINELAAGRLHQSNIFVKPGAVHRDGTEEFVMILPGCKVTCEKLDADGFKILYFEPDLHYGEAIKSGAKPGLYTANKIGSVWETKRKELAQIEQKEDRLVAICDSGYRGPEDAAIMAAPRLGEAPMSGGGFRVNNNGFDLHYTPGEKRIGGLKNYRNAIRPNQNTELHESALLLARTMHQAKDIKGIAWISEDGGSGVLTQAMTILAAQGIQLPNHTAFLFNPTTSPNVAVKAAHTIGLTLDRKFTKTRMANVVGNRDQLEMIGNRWKNKDDSLTALQAGADTLAHGMSLQGLGVTAGTVAAAVGVGMTAPAALTAFLTALGGAVAAGAIAGSTAKLGNTLVENLLPNHHDKWKGKF
jgi:hypothetical protein